MKKYLSWQRNPVVNIITLSFIWDRQYFQRHSFIRHLFFLSFFRSSRLYFFVSLKWQFSCFLFCFLFWLLLINQFVRTFMSKCLCAFVYICRSQTRNLATRTRISSKSCVSNSTIASLSTTSKSKNVHIPKRIQFKHDNACISIISLMANGMWFHKEQNHLKICTQTQNLYSPNHIWFM